MILLPFFTLAVIWFRNERAALTPSTDISRICDFPSLTVFTVDLKKQYDRGKMELDELKERCMVRESVRAKPE